MVIFGKKCRGTKSSCYYKIMRPKSTSTKDDSMSNALVRAVRSAYSYYRKRLEKRKVT